MRLQQFSVETEFNSMRIFVSVFLLLNSSFVSLRRVGKS